MCPWRGMGEKSTGIKFQCNCLLNCGLQILKFYPWFCVTTAVMNSAWLWLSPELSGILTSSKKTCGRKNDENHAGLPAKLRVSPLGLIAAVFQAAEELGRLGPLEYLWACTFSSVTFLYNPISANQPVQRLPLPGSPSSWWCFIRSKRARQPQ